MFFTLLLSNLIIVLSLLFKIKNIPPEIPLFYSRIWGESQIANRWLIVILPLLMNYFYLQNIIIRKKLFPENIFFKKVTLYLNIVVTLSFLVAFLRIISTVT